MKTITIRIAVFLLLTSFLSSKEVAMDEGTVVFSIPGDFSDLSQEEIKAKFPSVNAPKQVVGNEDRSTVIAYQLQEQPVKLNDLPDVQKALTKVFDRVVPGIEWKQNALVDLAGQKWLVLEMTSRAIDQDIHNIILITSHKGKMLVFNFNSTKKEFPKMEAILRDSIKTITLKP